MSQAPDQPQPTESTADETEEEHPLAVADPDEYNQNRRLKSIHNARDEAMDALRDIPQKASEDVHAEAAGMAGNAVAAYAAELLPLANRVEPELELENDNFNEAYGGIDGFIHYGGKRLKDGKLHQPPISACWAVLRTCDEFMHEVGLGTRVDPGLDDDLL